MLNQHLLTCLTSNGAMNWLLLHKTGLTNAVGLQTVKEVQTPHHLAMWEKINTSILELTLITSLEEVLTIGCWNKTNMTLIPRHAVMVFVHITHRLFGITVPMLAAQ